MRRLFTVLLSVLLTATAWAQAPQKMSYQAIIRNNSGATVTTAPIGMQISILQGDVNGKTVYVEKQTPTSNANGLVSIEIGAGLVVSGSFTSIDWANGLYYIKTETDPTGETAYTIEGTSQLLSVPYALCASNGLPKGSLGQLLYHNGTSWIGLSPGTTGQTLTYCNGIPTWGLCPTLLTTATIGISSGATATSGGHITSDGGTSVTARGVVWSTAQNPTIADNKTLDGAGAGTFSSTLTGLVSNTTYYVRSYATNYIGTTYGNEVSFKTATFIIIGQNYQGGIVFYFYNSSDIGFVEGETHGLIAAPSDQSTGIIWGSATNKIGTTDSWIGKGNENTNKIIANQGAGNYAAELCSNLVLNGYSDWFLPSREELRVLHGNKTIVGGFSPTMYWSSTEVDYSNAWMVWLEDGNTYDKYSKQSNGRVRAIRAF
jgi:hypothetical protein